MPYRQDLHIHSPYLKLYGKIYQKVPFYLLYYYKDSIYECICSIIFLNPLQIFKNDHKINRL